MNMQIYDLALVVQTEQFHQIWVSFWVRKSIISPVVLIFGSRSMVALHIYYC